MWSKCSKISENNLGLKVNYDKTTMYCIGSLRNSNAKCYTTRTFAWHDPPINTLGITVESDPQVMATVNLLPLIDKTKNILQVWKTRPLTLMGRVLIVNTLVESLLVYKFSILPQLDDAIVKTLQDEIVHFIWQGKKAKIAYNTLKRPKVDGGMRLVDICTRHALILCQRVFEIKDPYLEKVKYESLNSTLQHNIWYVNISEKYILRNCPNSFWRSVLIAWAMFTCIYPTTYNQVAKQFIWYNCNILIGRNIIFFPKACLAGCKFVTDVWNEDEN